jgi:V/A-type H+-transporting ATPase subunit F
MYKIAVMGDYDSIYGFATLGITTFAVDVNRAEEAQKRLKTIIENGYGVVYITEQLASVLHEEIEKYADRLMPAIIQIPGVRGNTGNGISGVKKSVEQAVGSDILFGNE